MTYALAFLAILAGVIAFSKLVKRQLDLHHPNVENEAELEAVLAHVLSKELRQ